MRSKKEIQEERNRREKEIIEMVLDKTFAGMGNISLARKKDIINCLRWVLGELKVIEIQGRGKGKLSHLK